MLVRSRPMAKWLLLALTASLSLVPLPASAASTVVVTNVIEPIEFPADNPCNGESILVSGEAHSTFVTVLDGAGGFHLLMFENLQHAVGVGDQGNEYRVPGVAVTSFNGVVGHEQTDILNFNFISKGPAPNFLQQEEFHITVKPDGTVATFRGHFTESCR